MSSGTSQAGRTPSSGWARPWGAGARCPRPDSDGAVLAEWAGRSSPRCASATAPEGLTTRGTCSGVLKGPSSLGVPVSSSSCTTSLDSLHSRTVGVEGFPLRAGTARPIKGSEDSRPGVPPARAGVGAEQGFFRICGHLPRSRIATAARAQAGAALPVALLWHHRNRACCEAGRGTRKPRDPGRVDT